MPIITNHGATYYSIIKMLEKSENKRGKFLWMNSKKCGITEFLLDNQELYGRTYRYKFLPFFIVVWIKFCFDFFECYF